MSLPRITATGNLATDPELRYTPTGTAVADLVVMCNERRKNDAGEWVDGDTIALAVSVWYEQAENVSASLHKGDAVTVTGSLSEDSWTDKDGQTRYRVKCRAEDVSASMRFATVAARKATRSALAAV